MWIRNHTLSTIVLGLLAMAVLIAPVSGALALALGIGYAFLFHHLHLEVVRLNIKKLLAWSIVGLGAGMNFKAVALTGIHGFVDTFIGIAFALSLGWLVSKILRSDYESSVLITVGTAICGGSAIAAIAPVIRAKSESVSVALGVVFVLNSVALLLFPFLGHQFGFTQNQFGLWSALAIHDTSSVVGATLQYGSEALRVGTTFKLSRTLWIVPIALLSSLILPKRQSEGVQSHISFPWFIIGFVLCAAFFTYYTQFSELGHGLESIAKRLFMLTLFLIGTTLSITSLKSVGIKPIVLGITLWGVVLTVSAIAIAKGFLQI